LHAGRRRGAVQGGEIGQEFSIGGQRPFAEPRSDAATHLSGGHGDSVACRSTAQFEIVENVVSGRSWARPLGGSEWSEVKPAGGNAVSELLREF
jgi:hypothetical protein